MNTIVVRKERADASNEDPPTYSPPPQLPADRVPLPLTTKPCNSVSVTRLEGDITGTFVIDPTLTILAALLLFNASDNLSLKASWGRADVDIYLIAGGRGRVTKSRTKLNVFAQNDVVVRLVSVLGAFRCAQFLLNAISLCFCAIQRVSGDGKRAPLYLDATSRGGSATVHIPRDFEGTMTFPAPMKQVKILGELRGQTALFQESEDQSRYFVGDIAEWNNAEKLDLLVVRIGPHRANTLEVRYVDEPVECTRKGILSGQ
jgi:hypothetical protein